MNLPRLAASVLAVMAVPGLAVAEDALRLELNTMESVQNRCRASLLMENKSDRQIESLQLDLVIFGIENTMQHRMVARPGVQRGEGPHAVPTQRRVVEQHARYHERASE